MVSDMRIYNHETILRAIDGVVEAAPRIAITVAVLYASKLVFKWFRGRSSRRSLIVSCLAVLIATTACIVVWCVQQPSDRQVRSATDETTDKVAKGDAWWQKYPLATEDDVRKYLLEKQGDATTNDCLLRTRPPTAEEVKLAFAKAIVASGYKIGDTTTAVIEREAPRIAATIQDMETVRRFVEKVNGVEHGFCYSLYSNGQIQQMGCFVEGKKTGPWRFFFPSGTLATKLQYDADGEETGQHVQYFRNGNVQYIEGYLDGLKHGAKTTFYEDGSTHIHQEWQRGKMHGISLIYYPNGILKRSASWANGQQHGTALHYDQTGRLTEQSEYINGQVQ